MGAITASSAGRRCRALVAVAAAGLACLPATAQAAETLGIGLRFSPYKMGANTTIVSDVRIGTTNGEVPDPAVKLELRFPVSLSLISSSLGLDICDPKALFLVGVDGCSPNSRMGVGVAKVAVPFGPEVVRENASIDVFMGAPTTEQAGPDTEAQQVTTLLLYGEGRTPVYAQLLLQGGLIGGTGAFNELRLKSNIPVIPTLPGARDVALTQMSLSLGPRDITYYKYVHGRKVGYKPRGIVLPVVCPKGGFQFSATVTFLNGSVANASPLVRCPRHGRRG